MPFNHLDPIRISSLPETRSTKKSMTTNIEDNDGYSSVDSKGCHTNKDKRQDKENLNLTRATGKTAMKCTWKGKKSSFDVKFQ